MKVIDKLHSFNYNCKKCKYYIPDGNLHKCLVYSDPTDLLIGRLFNLHHIQRFIINVWSDGSSKNLIDFCEDYNLK